jgi:hypothetical protein
MIGLKGVQGKKKFFKKISNNMQASRFKVYSPIAHYQLLFVNQGDDFSQ